MTQLRKRLGLWTWVCVVYCFVGNNYNLLCSFRMFPDTFLNVSWKFSSWSCKFVHNLNLSHWSVVIVRFPVLFCFSCRLWQLQICSWKCLFPLLTCSFSLFLWKHLPRDSWLMDVQLYYSARPRHRPAKPNFSQCVEQDISRFLNAFGGWRIFGTLGLVWDGLELPRNQSKQHANLNVRVKKQRAPGSDLHILTPTLKMMPSLTLIINLTWLAIWSWESWLRILTLSGQFYYFWNEGVIAIARSSCPHCILCTRFLPATLSELVWRRDIIHLREQQHNSGKTTSNLASKPRNCSGAHWEATCVQSCTDICFSRALLFSIVITKLFQNCSDKMGHELFLNRLFVLKLVRFLHFHGWFWNCSWIVPESFLIVS